MSGEGLQPPPPYRARESTLGAVCLGRAGQQVGLTEQWPRGHAAPSLKDLPGSIPAGFSVELKMFPQKDII